jgi:hypothetical protein
MRLSPRSPITEPLEPNGHNDASDLARDLGTVGPKH